MKVALMIGFILFVLSLLLGFIPLIWRVPRWVDETIAYMLLIGAALLIICGSYLYFEQ